jgi:hypothetical protein
MNAIVRWAIAIAVIGLLAIPLHLMPPAPRWLRVVAGVLAILALLGILGLPPGLRATWRRWLTGVILVFVVMPVLVPFGPAPPRSFWQDGNGPARTWGPRLIWSRPILSWLPDWLVPTTVGTVRHFSLSPGGELDGFILDNGAEVHVPPHLSAQLARAVRLDDSVTVRGYRAWFAPVTKAISITDPATGGMVVDTGPPPHGFAPPRSPDAAVQRMSPEGRLDIWLHGPAGDVNGALLADGTILRFPPGLGDQWAALVVPGQTIRAVGWGVTTAYGKVVAVQALGMTTASSPAQGISPSAR